MTDVYLWRNKFLVSYLVLCALQTLQPTSKYTLCDLLSQKALESPKDAKTKGQAQTRDQIYRRWRGCSCANQLIYVCMDEFQSWATPKTRILLNVGKGDPYEQAKYAVRIVCQAVAMFCLGMSVLCKDFHWHACDFMEFVNLLPTTKISNILRSTSGRLTRESRLLRINRPVSITKRESEYHLLIAKF